MSTFLSPHYTKLFQVRKWRGIWIFTTTVGFNVNTPKFVRSLIQLRFFLEHILGKFLFFCLEKLCHRSLQILFTKSNRIKRFMFSRKGKLVNKRNTLHKKVSVLGVILVRIQPKCGKTRHVVRGGSRAAATSKMKRSVIIANGLALHLGCCSSPRSASGSE